MALEASLCQLRASEKHIHPASEKAGYDSGGVTFRRFLFLGGFLGFFPSGLGYPAVLGVLWVPVLGVSVSVGRSVVRLFLGLAVSAFVCSWRGFWCVFPGLSLGFSWFAFSQDTLGFFSRVADAARESE